MMIQIFRHLLVDMERNDDTLTC